MALTITRATTNAHLVAIRTLFQTPVNGVSILDELAADWGAPPDMTAATWQQRMADPNIRILMGSQPANTLRGAGVWHREDGIWIVMLIGIDKSLTQQQRMAGLHDFFLSEAQQVPGTTRYGGTAIVGSSIYNYLTSRLPAQRVTPLPGQVNGRDVVFIQTTAAETLALL